jgi:hypothetical protein
MSFVNEGRLDDTCGPGGFGGSSVGSLLGSQGGKAVFRGTLLVSGNIDAVTWIEVVVRDSTN